MLRKLKNFCAREDIRGRLTIVLLSVIALVYGLIMMLGRELPPGDPNAPWILRLHPERILAMVATVLGSLRLIDHVQKQKNPIPPLLWILSASVVHLTSVALQSGWLS